MNRDLSDEQKVKEVCQVNKGYGRFTQRILMMFTHKETNKLSGCVGGLHNLSSKLECI